MHVEEVLFGKSFVKFAAEVTVLIIQFDFFVFRYFNELIFNRLNLIFMFWRAHVSLVLGSFGFNWPIFMISVITFTSLHLFFDCFDNLRPYVFQERLKSVVPHFTWNGNNYIDGCCSHLVIFIVDVLDNIINSFLIVFAQLILTYNFSDHFKATCQYFRRLLSLVSHRETFIANVLVRQLVDWEVAVNAFGYFNDFLVCMAQVIADFFHYVLCILKIARVSAGLHFSHKGVK